MLLTLLATTFSAHASDLDFEAYVRRHPVRHRPAERHAPPPAPVVATHVVSFTASVLDPAVGALGVGAEFRATPKIGIAAEGALGMNDNQGLYRVGCDAREYFLGNFDTGLFVGIGADVGNYRFFAPIEPSVGFGPSIGAKFTVPVVPITLVGSVGADLVASDTRVAIVPTIGASIGFSF